MKFFTWLFSMTTRHRRGIFKYEHGGVGSRIATIIVGFLWVGLLFLCEYGFLYIFHNPPSDGEWGLHLLYLLFLGAFSIGTLPAVLDYCICYAYVGIKTAILGSTPGSQGGEARNLRILDLCLAIFFLLLAAATALFFFTLLLNYGKYFPSKL